jgi:hypothetical protein
MKKILSGIAFAFAAAFLTSSMAMAGTTCPATNWGAYYPTPPGIASCAINNLIFSNFGFAETSSGGATVPTPTSVGVSVIQTPGNEGFSFDPGFTVGANQTQDVTLTFVVTAAPGTTISDLYINFDGSYSGTGSTRFSEEYCTGVGTGCNVFSVSNPNGDLSEEISIAPTTTLYITKDFGVNGGTDGSAGISQVINQFSNTSSVPEPASLSMMGIGLLGLGLIGRRKRKV